jgi:hypothetical protein
MIQSDVSAGLSGAAHTMAANLMARLEQAYPVFGGMWDVTVNEPGGVIIVTNSALSNKNGFVMHIDKIDPEGRKVVMYAGELLERFRISRSSRVRQVVDDIGAAARDFRGELVCDAS